MKKQTLNTSATKNTLADMAVSMVANGDTITPAPIVPDVPEIDVAKIYDGLKTKERKADTKTAQKNAQGNTGDKKSKSTRTKLADKINVAEMQAMPVSRDDNAPTVGELCESIKTTHEQMAKGQITQIEGFAEQGRALVQIKKSILSTKFKDADTKTIDREFGKALKQYGIGNDIIPRQARSMYIWLGDNERKAVAYVNKAIAAKTPTKEQKRVANAHKRIGLTPYVLMAAMVPNDNEKSERTAMDTAKAHLKQVMKQYSKSESNPKGLDPDSKTYDDDIMEQAKLILESALSELKQ